MDSEGTLPGMNRRAYLTAAVGAAATLAGCTSGSAKTSESDPRAEAINPTTAYGAFYDGDEVTKEIELPDGSGEARADVYVDVQRLDDGGEAAVEVTITNTDTGEVIGSDPGNAAQVYEPGASRTVRGVDVGNVWGDTVEVQVSVVAGEAVELNVGYSATVVSR